MAEGAGDARARLVAARVAALRRARVLREARQRRFDEILHPRNRLGRWRVKPGVAVAAARLDASLSAVEKARAKRRDAILRMTARDLGTVTEVEPPRRPEPGPGSLLAGQQDRLMVSVASRMPQDVYLDPPVGVSEYESRIFETTSHVAERGLGHGLVATSHAHRVPASTHAPEMLVVTDARDAFGRYHQRHAMAEEVGAEALERDVTRGFDEPLFREPGTSFQASRPHHIEITTVGRTFESAAFTMAHEVGHWVDQQVLGQNGPRPTAFQSDRASLVAGDGGGDGFRAWAEAWQASDTIHFIRRAKDEGMWDDTNTLGTGETYGDYLLLPKEVFARSYAQWVALETQDPVLMKELRRLQAAASPQVWLDGEFEPIARALEQIFRDEGLLIEDTFPVEGGYHRGDDDMEAVFREGLEEAKFNPLLHPRDRLQRFRDVPGLPRVAASVAEPKPKKKPRRRKLRLGHAVLWQTPSGWSQGIVTGSEENADIWQVKVTASKARPGMKSVPLGTSVMLPGEALTVMPVNQPRRTKPSVPPQGKRPGALVQFEDLEPGDVVLLQNRAAFVVRKTTNQVVLGYENGITINYPTKWLEGATYGVRYRGTVGDTRTQEEMDDAWSAAEDRRVEADLRGADFAEVQAAKAAARLEVQRTRRMAGVAEKLPLAGLRGRVGEVIGTTDIRPGMTLRSLAASPAPAEFTVESVEGGLEVTFVGALPGEKTGLVDVFDLEDMLGEDSWTLVAEPDPDGSTGSIVLGSEAAVAAMSRLHRIPAHARGVPRVYISEETDAGGRYHSGWSNDAFAVVPTQIEITRRASAGKMRTERVTHHMRPSTWEKVLVPNDGSWAAHVLLHEAGHWLDQQVLGLEGHHPTRYQSDIEPDEIAREGGGTGFVEWKDAVEQSDSIKEIQKQEAAGRWKDRDSKPDSQKVFGASFAGYLLSGKEVWARSYAQWVAVRSGDPLLLKYLRKAQASRDYSSVWQDEEFEPIGRAIDQIMREEGMLIEAVQEAARFNPLLHPRDRLQRFRNTPDRPKVAASRPPEARSWWHLTDNPHFALNPDFNPENNTTLGGSWPEKGIFLSENPEGWYNGHGYVRPFVAEIQGDAKVMGGYSGEHFLPASEFGKAKIVRVIPYDAWAAEQFEGKPYEGPDVRDMTPEQHREAFAAVNDLVRNERPHMLSFSCSFCGAEGEDYNECQSCGKVEDESRDRYTPRGYLPKFAGTGDFYAQATIEEKLKRPITG